MNYMVVKFVILVLEGKNKKKIKVIGEGGTLSGALKISPPAFCPSDYLACMFQSVDTRVSTMFSSCDKCTPNWTNCLSTPNRSLDPR
jgi:hypothetical protein